MLCNTIDIEKTEIKILNSENQLLHNKQIYKLLLIKLDQCKALQNPSMAVAISQIENQMRVLKAFINAEEGFIAKDKENLQKKKERGFFSRLFSRD